MKRFYRSDRKMIAGVCSGIADYFAIDPILVRIFFIVSLFFNGMGLLAYILLWIVSEHPPFRQESNQNRKTGSTRNTLGYILIMSGAFLLLDYIIPDFDAQMVFGIVMLSVGGAILYRNIQRNTLRENQA